MHPTLVHIPNHIPGLPWPVFGFGLLLAVWALAGTALTVRLVWKQGLSGDTLSHVALLLVLGAGIAWLMPRLLEDDGLPIRSYGVLLLVAVLAGSALATWRARRVGVDPEVVFSAVFWIVVPGIIGARALYVLRYWPDFQRLTAAETLGEIFNLAGGGLVVYGSLIGGLLGIVAFARRYRVPLLALADLLTPSLALGLAIGRVGCLMYGCCFGATCDGPLAITFPWGSPPHVHQVQRGEAAVHGLRFDGPEAVVAAVEAGSPAAAAGLRPGDRIVSIDLGLVRGAEDARFRLLHVEEGRTARIALADGSQRRLTAPAALPRSLAVQPTQLYGAINGLLLCLLLLAWDPFRRRDGELLALGLTVYPITRFLLELIRGDEAAVLGTGLKISQNISLLTLIAVVGLWWYILRQPRGLAFTKCPR